MKKLILKLLYKYYVGKTNAEFTSLAWCENYLKMRGYVKDVGCYMKGFVIVKLITNEQGLSSIEVMLDIDNLVNKNNTTIIKENLCTGLAITTRYFERMVC